MIHSELIQVALLQHMPLYFNALVVECTTRCNAKCAMCYQAAGPRGSDVLGDASLQVSDIEKVLVEAAEIENIHPRFHLTGGEAFLNVEMVLHLFAFARNLGFLDLTTTTNAYWARDLSRGREIAHRAREAGVTGMEVSWDYWHLPYVKPEAVNHCLIACHEAGIEVNLRLLSSKSHSFEEALALLDPAALELASRATGGPVFPTGRAARTLERTDLYPQGTLDDSCHTYLNLTVNARGNVFPCCAGIDQTTEFIFGNVREQSLHDVVKSMNRSPMLRNIVFRGIGSLIPILQEAGIEVGRDFNSICHMCWSIFSSPENVKAIKDHFEARERLAIERAIRQIEVGQVSAEQPVPSGL